jgi:hypothetical protein
MRLPPCIQEHCPVIDGKLKRPTLILAAHPFDQADLHRIQRDDHLCASLENVDMGRLVIARPHDETVAIDIQDVGMGSQ